MRLFIKLILLLCFGNSAILHAQTYYVDAIKGSDSFSGITKKLAWQSLEKVNNSIFRPGDSIRFKCGDIFQGTLLLKYSGTKNSSIEYSSYQQCKDNNKAIISASKFISNWQSINEKIFVTSVDYNVKQLFVDGRYISPARFPDSGFFSIDKNSINATGKPAYNFLTDSALVENNLTAEDLIGADIHIRTINWRIEDRQVSKFTSEGKLYWSNNTDYKIQKGFGYYLENKLWMLNKPGEWFYDKQSKLLYLWLPVNKQIPNNHPDKHLIEATQFDSNIKALTKVNNVTIESLKLQHAAQLGLLMGNSNNNKIKNLTITGTGQSGIFIYNATNIVIKNNILLDNVRDGVRISVSDNITVSDNTLTNTGTIGSPLNSLGAIHAGSATNSVFKNNVIKNSGYIGIRFGYNTTVKNNLIENSCMILDDCAAIYTWNNISRTNIYNSQIKNNVIINVLGNTDGRPAGRTLSVGIYLDDFSNNVTVSHNTITNSDRGIFLHNSFYNNIINNTLYGNRHYELSLSENGSTTPPGTIRNNKIKDNIFFPTKNSISVNLGSAFNTIDFAFFINNQYSALYSTTLFNEFYTPEYPKNRTISSKFFTLLEWQKTKDMELSATLFDAISIPGKSTPSDSLLLVNKTNNWKQIKCPFKNLSRCEEYIDIENQVVNWPVMLKSKQSKIVVWKNNPNRKDK